MAKYVFVTNVTISMHVEVEADDMDAAVEAAREAGVMSLCHQCSHGEPGCWNTSGEIDGMPSESPLVDVTCEGESVSENELAKLQGEWV